MSINSAAISPLAFSSISTPSPNPTNRVQKTNRACRYSKIGYFFSNGMEETRKIAIAANQFFANSSKSFYVGLTHFSFVTKVCSAFELAIMPLTFVNIAKHSKNYTNGTREEKIDSALEIVSELGILGRSATILTAGMASVGVVSTKFLEWTAPFFLITSAFTLIASITQYRTYVKISKFEKEFLKIGKISELDHKAALEEFDRVVKTVEYEFYRNKELARTIFNYKDKVIKDRLNEILNESKKLLASSSKEDQDSGKALMNQTIQALRGRVQHAKSTAKYNMALSVISIVVAGILCASPAAPIALALGGVVLAANLGVFIHHKVVEYRHAKELGIKKKWHEWITC